MIQKKPKWSQIVYGAKVHRCCEAVFKCGYYIVMTAWCFQLLRDKSWFPRVLGGVGETRHCWTDGYPFQELPSDLQQFYLTVAGYHLSEVVLHMSQYRCPDFW